MNRREFLKGLFATGALVATSGNVEAALENPLVETEKFSDGDFVTYITYTMNLICDNLSSCAVINNIEESNG